MAMTFTYLKAKTPFEKKQQMSTQVNLSGFTVGLDHDWSESVSDRNSDLLTSHHQLWSGSIVAEELGDRLWFNFPELGRKVEPSRTFNH